MTNNSSSIICIEILSSIQMEEQKIEQKLFATDQYIYMEIAGKQIIYLPKKNEQYLIDSEQKRLVKIDMSAQIAQFQQLKQLIGELSVENKPLEKGRYVHLSNINRSVVGLDVEAEITTNEEIGQTVFSQFEEFQIPMRPFSVKINDNEIITSVKSVIIIGGQAQESVTEVLEIRKIENPSAFDFYLSFEIND